MQACASALPGVLAPLHPAHTANEGRGKMTRRGAFRGRRDDSGGGFATMDHVELDFVQVTLSHFATADSVLRPNHKAALKRLVPLILGMPGRSRIACEGRASSSGGAGVNLPLSAARMHGVQQYLLGLLTGRISRDEAAPDGFQDDLGDVGEPISLSPASARQNGFSVDAQGGIVVPTRLALAQQQLVVFDQGNFTGDTVHNAHRAQHGGRDQANNPKFRAVVVQVTTRLVPRRRKAAEPEPASLHFLVRLSNPQPDKFSDPVTFFNDALKRALRVAKAAKLKGTLEKIVNQVLPKLTRFGKNAKKFLLILKSLGIEIIALDIMDVKARRGQMFIYVGVAPNTDALLETAVDTAIKVVDEMVDQLPPGAQVLVGELADRLKKALKSELLHLELQPPFRFEPFQVPILKSKGSDGMVTLEMLPGPATIARFGNDPTLIFENDAFITSPRQIRLRTATTRSLSNRFGLAGVLLDGAKITFTTSDG